MNTTLLRLATKSKRGVRHWTVPGFSNGVKFLPASQSMRQWNAQAVYWPDRDKHGELIRGARLDIHQSVVRQEITKLIKSCGDIA